MTAVRAYYAEATNVTASTTSWVQVCTLANTNFTAGRKYLIVANSFVEQNSAANEARIRLVHGTTPTVFDDSSAAYEFNNGTQQTNIGFMYVWTQPGTAEAITLQISNSGTFTTTCRLGQLLVIDLDDIGTEDTDYRYTEDLTDYTTTSSYVSKASETFTPNGTDDWLIVGHACFSGVQTTTNHQMRLNDSVAGALATIDIEGEDATNEIRSYLMMCVVTPTNASHTFSVQFAHETTAVTVLSNRIFCLKLNKFAVKAYSRDVTADAPTASPTWKTTRTVAPTPSVTGDWIYWGYFGNDVGTLTDDLDTRLQVNPDGSGLVSDPNYTGGPGIDSWDATDIVPWNMFKKRSLSTGAARTINMDAMMVAGTTLRWVDRTLVAFSLELAGGGTQYNQTVSGAITPAGAMVKQTNTVKTGAVSPAGVLAKLTSTAKTGAITPAGALVKQAQPKYSGAVSPTGTLVKQSQPKYSGAVSPTGAISRRISTTLTGTLSSAGTLVKRTATSLTGTLASTGVLSSTKVVLLALTGALTPAGQLVKQTATSLSGALTPAGQLIKQTAMSVTGALTPAGQLVKQTAINVAGTMTSTGTLIKQTATALAGSISSTGALVKQTAMSVTGALTPSGILDAVKAGVATFSIALTGSITPDGVVGKQVNKLLVGALTPVGVLVKLTAKVVSGIVSMGGGLTIIASTILPDLPGRGVIGHRRTRSGGIGSQLTRSGGVGSKQENSDDIGSRLTRSGSTGSKQDKSGDIGDE